MSRRRRTSGETHCTDDGVGLLYRGTELVGAVTELPGKAAYRVTLAPSDSSAAEVLEARLEPTGL